MTVVPRRRPSVFDLEKAQQAATEGLARAEQTNGPVFSARLYRALLYLAKTRPYVNADLIWQHIGMVPTHSQGSVLGGAFRRAMGEGIIEQAGWVMSQRPSQKTSSIRQWRSLLLDVGHTCVCRECGNPM